MIEIYPNRLEGTPIETHKVDRRMSICEFLNSIMDGGYQAGEAIPLSVFVDDELIPFEDWALFIFRPKDRVRIHIEPKGTDPFSITVALFAGVKAVFGMLMPKLPGTPGVPGTGDSLSQGSVRGNKIKLGDPVREIAGRMKVYPDYVVPVRKRFANYREQWTELGLCVGVGRMQILADNVKIGDTSILALGADAEYQIFEPGASVGEYSPFLWWHTAPEVGASSTGAAGLELTAASAVTPAPGATQFVFNAYTVSIPAGQGSFPTDWTVGLVLRIIAPYSYTVTDGGGTARDIISGPLAMLAPSVGDAIEVVGVNGGKYIVNSYNSSTQQMTLNREDGSPANNLTLGDGLAAIGPDGLRFRITSIGGTSMTVERLDAAGATDVDFPGFNAGTLAGASVRIDESNYESGWRGPFAACPIGEETANIELDFFYPEGLCGVGREGQVYQISVTYEIQWRMVGETAWNSVVLFDANATLDQGGYTKSIALGRRGRPEVRVRKVDPLGDNIEWHSTVQWYSLRCLLNAPLSYPGATTIGLKVRTSDRISAQTESLISVIATRILPGADGVERPTRSIRDFAAYVPRSLGLPDSRVNTAELNRLDATWVARGDNFDMSYDSESTAQQVLMDVFGAGFSELTLEQGQITPVRDEPRSVFEQMYTPQNMTSYLKRNPKFVANPDEFDGVEITFTDAATWSEATIICKLPGDLGIKLEKVNAVGITDRTKAYQMGMRRRRIQRYRPDVFSWETEADALVSRYLSYCAVADDVNGYPQSALLETFTIMMDGSYELEVTEQFDWSGQGAPQVLLRKQDGTASGPYPATRIDDFTLSIPAPDFDLVTFNPVTDPTHILFGTSVRMCYPVLITSISPNGFAAASVEAVGYDGRVYLDDDSTPP